MDFGESKKNMKGYGATSLNYTRHGKFASVISLTVAAYFSGSKACN